jgi:N-acyl-D-aspartate/D-glutamate deacylase
VFVATGGRGCLFTRSPQREQPRAHWYVAAVLDVLLRGAEVVDGTGSPRRCAEVGIDHGRIVLAAAGTAIEAARTVDVGGLVVAPGFVDIHTHYDAQVLWDPMCTPSPFHGVTTVIGGNCGFTLAPLGDDTDVDYVMRMMARVEGMSIDALRAGPPWDWRTFGEWLDRIDGRLGVNAGFLVGHSTVRRSVMGEAAHDASTPEQVDAMVATVHDAMASGALGVSSSLGEAHTDGDGAPVPSRAASHAELLALARAARDHEGTTLEFIAAMGEIPDDRIELMTEMSLAANRPLNWNLLGSLSPTEVYEQQLTSCDHARARGARVVALTLPDLMRMRADRVLDDLPGWRDVAELDPDARRRAITDPDVRARLRAGADEAMQRGLGAIAQPELLEIAGAPGGSAGLVGRSIADVAAERGADPVDVLIDVVLPDRLPLTLVFPSLVPSLGRSDEGWRVRAGVWRDDRTVLGGSDAGAHADLMCHANYTTMVLGESVRERGLLTLEEAVRQLSDVPARLYGLRDRGRIADGCVADLVVFDPDSIGSGTPYVVHDLPAGGERLSADGHGIESVYVNGREVVARGASTGDLPGALLRSGRDTETVTVPGARESRGQP